MAEPSIRIAVVLASAGRPKLLAEAIHTCDTQEGISFRGVISVPDGRSLPPRDMVPSRWEIVSGVRGLAAQRNAALDHLADSVDFVFFFDDDAVLRSDYIRNAVAFFEARPQVVGLTGRVLDDGKIKGQIPADEAASTIAASWSVPLRGHWSLTRELYGANFAVRLTASGGLRFDDRLPLYSWLEDHDFARRLMHHGELIIVEDCRMVHRAAASGGRTSHRRLGYSQVMNAAYLRRKGSFPLWLAAQQIARPVAKNILQSIGGRNSSWRRERLNGNCKAALDLLRGRFTPERISESIFDTGQERVAAPSESGEKEAQHRIVHVLKHSRRCNGNVNVAIDLACDQSDRGHDVFLLSGGGDYDGLLKTHHVKSLTIPMKEHPFGRLRSTLSTFQALVNLRPEVIHAHMMSSALVGRAAAWVSGAHLVTTVHNSFDSHSRLMRVGDRVVAVSEAERALLLQRSFSSRRTVTIVNGSGQSPRESIDEKDNVHIDGPALAVLSGLHSRKAVDVVVDAFSKIAPEFPNWTLYIAGDGPDRSVLESLALRNTAVGRIVFLGPLWRPSEFLSKVDIFVTATRADPCPLVIAEARSARCAVIATEVGGIPELLDGGRAGRLVPVDDADAMAAAMHDLLAATDELELWKDRALQNIDYFRVRRMSDDYLALYGELLSRQTSSRARFRDWVAS